ncbi:BatA domain-containing protein [Tuwongella immobilis]|uniref:Aerotolerance regulator N-terminal domain-containing protein n=1 Tax=Tuwongella immobilis TaxID=692036 RepID=A0A6C2YVL2_9BACT|nr:BatA domain-containing protein [Tuwongella immobilis]VIP05788.1 N-terminal double-transmembrane domain-containing protein OS=Singulisphaera acidiphila (strain ATCC BAA-1392 / DSM 18658 / VKM B-2454 / MOB10) GN=Sinac_2675 PE=4 SV=1: BatA: VWA_2 [Tuwongella immobilis]VTS08932.1 N-terminal double-transmembrane domain-containing protein OS=Singulisphaera acidiphila (strain ATCC BAA-1392 / DSM 18658 / VKM B-2454 / MOB10) GN=Sinac_2675 PE=4 SV=1: BatA: VWA_2 [Tuwongella immobilis]
MHPVLITGAVLVGLPILLHLIMRQEPKRLPFPAFRFLKETVRTNQRKLKLRHWLLLAMRMLLIALLAAALFQPSIISDQFPITGDSPVATAIVLDTSPSMGYSVGERTRLDEAKTRALELLDELPEESPVVVIDTGESAGGLRWLNSTREARKIIEAIARPKPANKPVTAAIDQAYRLFPVLDRERDRPGETALPRLVAVFSDRTLSSWSSDRVPEILQSRDRVPPPEIRGLYLDVSVEKPINLGITRVQIQPAIIPADQPAIIQVTLQATGGDLENVLVCRIDGERTAEQQPVKLLAGETKQIRFRRTDLKPGIHQAEVTLLSPDALLGDNVRFATFRIREPRLILTISDEPDAAAYWKLALEASQQFSVEVKTPGELRDWKPADWNRYEAITLLSVAAPGSLTDRPGDPPLWSLLDAYINRGGKLIVFPGGDELKRADWNSPLAERILPGKLAELIVADPKKGETWLWNSLDTRHPLLAPFREWQQQQPPADFIRLPPVVFRYWKVTPSDTKSIIVSYGNEAQSPALLERTVGRGQVVLFTTPWDARRDSDDRPWNDYLQTSFYPVLSNLVIRYLLGDTVQRTFDYQAGTSVTVPIPLTVEGQAGQTFLLEGPGIGGSNALLKRTEAAPDRLIIDRDRTTTAGNFLVMQENRQALDGFSLNIDSEESLLERVEVANLEAVLGPDCVLPTGQAVDLRSMLDGRFNQPIDLFPWLMILLLLILAVENFLANRFYRRPSVAPVTPTNRQAGVAG